MARCNSCEKFRPYGEPEVEADISADEDGTLTGTVELVLPCEDCGDGMRQATFDVSDTTLVDAVAAHRKAAKDAADAKRAERAKASPPKEWEARTDQQAEDDARRADDEDEDEDHELDADGADAEGDSRTEGKGRGLRTFYGYHATVTVTCSCGHKFDDVELSEDTQASNLEEV